jgi:hypothetical protein
MIAKDGGLRLRAYTHPCLRHEAQIEKPTLDLSESEKRFRFQ